MDNTAIDERLYRDSAFLRECFTSEAYRGLEASLLASASDALTSAIEPNDILKAHKNLAILTDTLKAFRAAGDYADQVEAQLSTQNPETENKDEFF